MARSGDAGLAALRECEGELAWLWEEVSRERVPETDPSGWTGKAAAALGHRLVELSYFVDEAARHLAAAREAVDHELWLREAAAGG